ncbi:hypothetical protein CJP72_21895 [Citrobacter sp. NCU1]|uniref:Rha family phage regulatory protein n=1 Tax=Citrobacter sp. NCU1 TaxID=2026683 RepID=UPI001391000C|nr:Rha family phage regulatory protein [Citrobacter sp. NCU1]NDO83312.1 hypothetical protein [Citrobacter sp. NCU1]
MNLHIDSQNFGRYTVLATAKSVAGRGNPEYSSAQPRSAVFLCEMHCYTKIMVGRAGQLSGWPVSWIPGISTPVRLTTSKRGNFGGELSSPESEVAIMATVPSFAQPEITLISGRAVTSSLAVAAYFSKRHDNIIQKIQTLECSPDFIALNFKVNEYTDAIGRKLPCYEITRSGFMFLAMGFTGKKAAHLKESYINAFDAMEAQLSSGTMPEYTQIILTLKNGVVVDSRPVREGEYTCCMETFFEMAERQGYLVIHTDDLKSLSFGTRKRGDS